MHKLVGKKVETRFGVATVKRHIKVKNWFHIEYSDGSIGWVSERQFRVVEE